MAALSGTKITYCLGEAVLVADAEGHACKLESPPLPVVQLSACAGALAADDRDGLRVAQAAGRAAGRGAQLVRAGVPLWLHRAAGGALPPLYVL